MKRCRAAPPHLVPRAAEARDARHVRGSDRHARVTCAACLLLGASICPRAEADPGRHSAPRPVAASAEVAVGAARAGAVAGQAALDRARAAWDKGDFDIAEPLYAEALETGGLAPPDVLDAYVHLGSARAVLGKKAPALVAFKAAATLDPDFTVPPEAGKRATTSADVARRLERKVGPLVLHAEMPTEVASGSGITVDVTLDGGHAAMPGYRLGVYAHDPARGAVHVASMRAAPSAKFDLPSALLLPGATLQVRVDWLDVHANRLASAEDQIHVLPPPSAPVMAPLALEIERPAPHDAGKAHGFWHTAWPYILGGVALAAGGAAVYFATRSGEDVNVTGVRVLTH